MADSEVAAVRKILGRLDDTCLCPPQNCTVLEAEQRFVREAAAALFRTLSVPSTKHWNINQVSRENGPKSRKYLVGWPWLSALLQVARIVKLEKFSFRSDVLKAREKIGHKLSKKTNRGSKKCG